jgi:hypothetical protein
MDIIETVKEYAADKIYKSKEKISEINNGEIEDPQHWKESWHSGYAVAMQDLLYFINSHTR